MILYTKKRNCLQEEGDTTMSEKKVPTMFMLSGDVINALQEKTQQNLRSMYMEDLLRRELGLPPRRAPVAGWVVYQRSIDSGKGRQIVCVNDGVIVSQRLTAAPKLFHSYMGNGNPELIGQPVQTIYGIGFKRVRSPYRARQEREEWISQ